MTANWARLPYELLDVIVRPDLAEKAAHSAGLGMGGGERGKGYQNGAKTEPDAGNPDVGKHMNSSVKTPLRRLRILPYPWVSSVLDPRRATPRTDAVLADPLDQAEQLILFGRDTFGHLDRDLHEQIAGMGATFRDMSETPEKLFTDAGYRTLACTSIPLRAAQAGILVNAVLAVIKLVAGLVGRRHHLVNLPILEREDDPANRATEPSGMAPEKRLFAFSIIYLFAIFGALVADRWLLG